MQIIGRCGRSSDIDGEGHELAAAFGDAAMNVKKFISFGKRLLKPSQKLSKERPFHSWNPAPTSQ